MKKMVLIFCLFLPVAVWGQQKLLSRNAHIHFISHTDIIDIEGQTHQAGSIINLVNGEIVFAVPMKSFKFELALAEDHFNEDYLESEKYPKASFAGSIKNISEFNLNQEGVFEAQVEGTLNLHGQSRQISAKAILEKMNEKWVGQCTFSILLADYNIQIPNLVKDKVAPVIPIVIKAEYSLLNK